MAEDRKREQVLPPGTYAYILDGTKGQVRIHVGPLVINQTNQDTPVLYNHRTHRFEPCSLEGSVVQNVVVPEGFYAVLINPAKSKEGRDLHPEIGRLQDAPDLFIGHKENIPGPVNFALYPGQSAEVRRGHHLRSNEFLRVKIYNEDKARENWSKAVVKSAANTDGGTATDGTLTSRIPKDLAVGKQYNILGTEVSFYIPPTGVSVVPEGVTDEGKPNFVRDAETLEQLEYAILVDEDGNKEYPRGPRVVFPKPTQRFLTDAKGHRKFRAIEMNELQGIQLKFITDVKLTFADATAHQFTAGEETFITGKSMPIYYPEEGHQLVKYDGKTIHYAVAIPEGEARYVMNRKTGEITTVTGPTMLLPNPVTEIIVRRALSDQESMDWFPGPDGTGSKEALAYNRWLRDEAAKEPTTRQGVVSEGRIEQQTRPRGEGGFSAVEAAAQQFQAASPPAGRAAPAPARAKTTMVQESRQGKPQDAMLGDVAERSSTFNEPRMLTFGNKYKGVPTIKVRPGYAINLVDTDGERQVFVGPTRILVEYGQTLEVLSLSTGKPKTSDRLLRTAYLNVHNNKISDIMEVETIDHVRVSLKLSYNVNFEGPHDRWFTIENYVKHLCDHARSILKGKVRKIRIEDFYSNSTDLIRAILLGEPKDGGARPGLAFPENGMRVTDVEVLVVEIADSTIGELLAHAQHQVVQQNITLSEAEKRLEVVRKQEEINRQEAEAKFTTAKRKAELEADEVANQLALALAKLNSQLSQQVKRRDVEQAQQEITTLGHQSHLGREKATYEQAERLAVAAQKRELESVQARAQAVIAQLQAIQPGLIEALQSTGAREMLERVAHSLSFHAMFGASNGVEFIQKVFANTPLEDLVGRALKQASASPALPAGNGNGNTGKPTPTGA
jgi:major vault protein